MPENRSAAERHQATLRLAYILWEQAGRPLGQDQEFWDRAERQIREQDAPDPDGKADNK
jgi:hypothetical protein